MDTTKAATQVFKSKGPLRLRIKTQKAEIQGYRADGKPIYRERAIYADFVEGVIMLNPNLKEEKEMIEILRKHPANGSRFYEVSPHKVKGDENVIAKISLQALRSLNKKDLLALCDMYKIKGVKSDTDTKDEIVKAIQNFYSAH